jgi:hypothetical protein
MCLSLLLCYCLDRLDHQVSCTEEELGTELVGRFQVVVLIDVPLELQLEVDDFCHAQVQFLSSVYSKYI